MPFLLMRRRISEINAISSAMEARLLGKTVLIRNPEKARKMRLSLTLALLLCLTALFSVAGTAAFSYGSSAPANRKQIHQYYQRAVRQVAAYLDGLLSSYRQALENIAVNENVQYLFHAPANAANSAALWKLDDNIAPHIESDDEACGSNFFNNASVSIEHGADFRRFLVCHHGVFRLIHVFSADHSVAFPQRIFGERVFGIKADHNLMTAKKMRID